MLRMENIYIVCTYVNIHTRMSVKCVCVCVPARMKSARAHDFPSKTENRDGGGKVTENYSSFFSTHSCKGSSNGKHSYSENRIKEIQTPKEK